MLRHLKLFALSMNDPIIPSKSTGYPCQSIHRNLETSLGMEFPLRSLSHDGSMVLLYMVTWIPSIYPLYVSIYTSTMDPMGMKSSWNDYEYPWILTISDMRRPYLCTRAVWPKASAISRADGRTILVPVGRILLWYFSRICGTLW